MFIKVFLTCQIGLVCRRRIIFCQGIRTFLEDYTGLRPTGEIRGGLREQLADSNVGLKMRLESRKYEKPVTQHF